MFIIGLEVKDQYFYFSGWDASDTDPKCNGLVYWNCDPMRDDVWTFDSVQEAKIETVLIQMSRGFPIGLPEGIDFNDYDVMILSIEEAIR